jgi:ABC-type Zn2+ transport system substrate-binding protein/surface adhesin
MDTKQARAMQKKKERERENAEHKEREHEHDREETRSGTVPRHIWFFALGSVLVLLIILTWILFLL